MQEGKSAMKAKISSLYHLGWIKDAHIMPTQEIS